MSIEIYRRHIASALTHAAEETGWKFSSRELWGSDGVLFMISGTDVPETLEEQEIIINFQRETDRPRFIQLELPFEEGEEDASDSE